MMNWRISVAVFGTFALTALPSLAAFEVYFLRHGQTDWNLEHRLQGSVSHTKLTEEGRRIADETARGMKAQGIRFDRIYTSPYDRARETAERIAPATGPVPVADRRLREMCFGIYEGRTYGKGCYLDDNLRHFFEDTGTYVPTGEGAESFEQVQARLRDFLDNELRPLDGRVRRVLCVAHSLVLKSLVRELAGASASAEAKKTIQPNCCAHVVRFDGGKFSLVETGKVFCPPAVGLSSPCRALDAEERWSIVGDFGRVVGAVGMRADGYAIESHGCRVETKVVSNECGVVSRQTHVRNVGTAPVVLKELLDRQTLDGDDWEVYAQSNGWQKESVGCWRPLDRTVEVRCDKMRACDDATPMLAVWNRRTNRGVAFHVIADGQWLLRAVRLPAQGKVRIEAGYNPTFLNWRLASGETMRLPEVLTYAFGNRTDLDCHKLHAYWNARCPATDVSLAPIYNTWLCRFDKLDLDFVLRQVARAKEIGFEYFVVDAGWFGPKANWWNVRGDWEEREDGWLGGRLGEVAKAVRAAGMKFGFWVEAECASENANVVKEHPEWFFRAENLYFLDFRKSAASDALVERVSALVKRYDASFVKFDFNQTAREDPSGRVWAEYNAAYRRFVETVRARNPGIYLEGCASGGYMMCLGWSRTFDGFWPTDNQSAYAGVRIAKETMLRLPPRCMERWFTLLREEGLQPSYSGPISRLLTTEDATWTDYRTLSPSRVDAFAAGGPFCMSCNLLTFNKDDVAHFRGLIRSMREDAAFWKTAVGRILADTPDLTVFQYSDVALSDIRLVAIPSGYEASATIRPAVDMARSYVVDGTVRTGQQLAKDGLSVKVENGNCWLRTLRVGSGNLHK